MGEDAVSGASSASAADCSVLLSLFSEVDCVEVDLREGAGEADTLGRVPEGGDGLTDLRGGPGEADTLERTPGGGEGWKDVDVRLDERMWLREDALYPEAGEAGPGAFSAVPSDGSMDWTISSGSGTLVWLEKKLPISSSPLL